jgi:TonB-dependent starch-binding outer membrane protein SusC
MRCPRLLSLLGAGFLLATPAGVMRAQATGIVKGRVTDASSQRPVPDAQIVVVGSGSGALSGPDGSYTIAGVTSGSRVLRVRRIGFTQLDRAVTIESGGTTTADFAITPSATELEQIVVTGTAGSAAKRTIGNSVTTVNVGELAQKTTLFNVSEALQSKTPGVTLMPGSGAPGTAGEFRIRGAGSVSGYRPVVFIDGVRYNIESMGNFAATGAGLAGLAQSTQITSALDFLNPNDIESIQVIKGPAAGTLYGAEAANGVIQIITKKGTRGQQRLRWSVRGERGESEWRLRTPDNYTTCDSLKIAQMDTQNPPQPVWPGCQGVARNTVLTDNPLFRDPRALRVGDLSRLSTDVRGGGDRYSLYISGDREIQQGTFFNSDLANTSVRSNFTFNPEERLDFAVNVNWQQSNLRLPMQDESAAGLLLSSVRGRAGRASTLGPTGEGWATIRPDRANSYRNFTGSDRITLGGTINFNPRVWFQNRFTIGIDNTQSEAQLLFLPGDEGEPAGANSQQFPMQRYLTIDYSTKALAHWRGLDLTSSAGAQVVASERRQLGATGRGIGAPDVILIGSAQTTSGTETFSENNSLGYYFQQEVGWGNRLFLTGAVRADDNSSFGENFNVIVYPKFSASYVMSDEPAMQSLLRSLRVNSLRLRGAWGQAGRAPSPYSATQTYTVSVVTLGTNTGSAVRSLAYGNPDLKPERGEEIELGFDAGLFQERLGIDFTYYDKTTSDMLQSVSVAPSTGFQTTKLANLGEVSNKGIEVALSATPIDNNLVTWDSRLSVATNRNRLESFGIPGKISENPTGQAYAVVQQHRVGYPMGGYWAAFPKRNADGTPILTPGGAVDTIGQTRYIGPSAPTREIGFSNTLTFFKYFRVYALLDFKGGHYLFNQKERNRCQTANDNCAVVNDPRARFPVTAADSILNKELLVWRTIPAMFIEPADFAKLRELSLVINTPVQWARRMGFESASFVLAGRNLALWSDYKGLDPEVSSYGGRNFVRVDAYAAPMTRRLSASVNLTF